MEGFGSRRPKNLRIRNTGYRTNIKNRPLYVQCSISILRNFAKKVKSKKPWQGWLRGREEAGCRGPC
jgi:hypothetical protein